MQTNFTLEQLADPRIATANDILRKCVHCGFCTATCPTYILLGDELDSPRGRIYLIKEMLESGEPAKPEVVKHVDRCLSCLSCMTTCPASVNYMHLVDEARTYIEETHQRPLIDRVMRNVLNFVLPNPDRFAFALKFARLAKPLASFVESLPGLKPAGAMLKLAPSSLQERDAHNQPGRFAATGERRGRVALLGGCAQPVLNPAINRATIQVLNRLGVEVISPEAAGCCGALSHHMGKESAALDLVRANVDAWTAEIEGKGLDAIIINASGCGTTVKDYGHMLRLDSAYAKKAARVASLARDITEYLAEIRPLEASAPQDLTVAYHSACSMQHGQKITTLPKRLLSEAGFSVRDVPEGHICCGSAGTYNILQPDIATRLRDRKVANIESVKPDVIAAGNIGCLTQIATGTGIPVVHTVELLNWALGGEKPGNLT